MSDLFTTSSEFFNTYPCISKPVRHVLGKIEKENVSVSLPNIHNSVWRALSMAAHR